MTDTPPPASDSGSAPEIAKGARMISEARLDEEVGKRQALEREYAEFAEAVLAEIPERLKPLIPADYGPAQKLKWYRDAKNTGVFDARPHVPETDRGKPATTPKDRDFSTLPVHARIAAGYGKA